MPLYEHVYLARQDISPQQVETLTGQFKAIITSLGGTSVTVNNTPAPIFYSTLGQIGIQVPYEVVGQSTAQIVVTVAGQSSVPRAFK